MLVVRCLSKPKACEIFFYTLPLSFQGIPAFAGTGNVVFKFCSGRAD